MKMRDVAMHNVSRELHRDAAAAMVDMSIVGMPYEASASQRQVTFDATYTPENGGKLEIVQSKRHKPEKVLAIVGIFSGLAAEAADVELMERIAPPDTAPGPYRVEGTLSFVPKPQNKFQSFVGRLLGQESNINSSEEAKEAAAAVISGFRKALAARKI